MGQGLISSEPGSYFRVIQLGVPFLFGLRLFSFLMYRRWHKAYKTMHTKMKNRAKEAKIMVNITAVVLNALIFAGVAAPYIASYKHKKAVQPNVPSLIGLGFMIL